MFFRTECLRCSEGTCRALDSLVEFLLEPSATDGRSVEEVRRRAMELLEGRPLPDELFLKLSLV